MSLNAITDYAKLEKYDLDQLKAIALIVSSNAYEVYSNNRATKFNLFFKSCINALPEMLSIATMLENTSRKGQAKDVLCLYIFWYGLHEHANRTYFAKDASKYIDVAQNYIKSLNSTATINIADFYHNYLLRSMDNQEIVILQNKVKQLELELEKAKHKKTGKPLLDRFVGTREILIEFIDRCWEHNFINPAAISDFYINKDLVESYRAKCPDINPITLNNLSRSMSFDKDGNFRVTGRTLHLYLAYIYFVVGGQIVIDFTPSKKETLNQVFTIIRKRGISLLADTFASLKKKPFLTPKTFKKEYQTYIFAPFEKKQKQSIYTLEKNKSQ